MQIHAIFLVVCASWHNINSKLKFANSQIQASAMVLLSMMLGNPEYEADAILCLVA